MKQNYKLLLAASLSLFVSYISLSQTIIRGPYLQKGTPTSVIVKWRTNSSTSSIIEYSTDTSYNLSLSQTTPKTDHELEITGLSPGTKYFYRIGTGGALLSGSTDIYFKTHPTIGTSNPYTFWVVGNAGRGGSSARQDAEEVRDAYYSYIGSNESDGILFLGDNAMNSGTDSEYQEKIFDTYDSQLKNTIAWSCLGNHEGETANSGSQTGPYYDIFTFPTSGESGGMASGTESYYSFDYGNIHFIVLNSFDENRAVGGAMYDWAENDIQNTTQQWIVALWHHPPYSKGYHASEGFDGDGNPAGIELREMRENFVPMLEDNGVDLVIAAHSVSYERSYFINGHYGLSNTFDLATHTVGQTGQGDGKINGDGAYSKTSVGENAGLGTVYVVTSTASDETAASLDHNAMYYSVSNLGSSILEVNDYNITLKFLRKNGDITDYFTIEKTRTWYQDLDSDTFGNPFVTQISAPKPSGYVDNNTDCDDTDENVNPGATEIVNNGIDDDCNPATSDGSVVIDADGDGYTANGGNLFSDNFNRTDSNDLGPDWTHSTGLGGGAAGIVSNTVENIETGGGTFAVAFRKGTFGDDQWAEATFAGGGVSWSGVALRCDATSSVVWQCSGSVVQMLVMTNGSVRSIGKVNYTVVEGDVIRGEVSGTTYKVFINDNLVHTIINPSGANTSGNPGIMVEGYAMDDWSGGDTYNNTAADCDDTDAAVNPGATEVPYNGIDDDCNPLTLDDDLDSDGFDIANDCDDTDATVNEGHQYYVDADGDGFGSTTTELLCAITAPAGYSDNDTDCDDTDEDVNPGATEIVGNGIDDDCNPATSDSSGVIDADGDGYTPNEGDCNDSDSAVNPGAAEVPYNGIDDDCDPLTLDDDLDGDGFDNANDCDDTDNTVDAATTYYVDADGDGFGSTAAELLCASMAPTGYSDNNTDCDDTDENVNPGATEMVDNGIDDDCNPATPDSSSVTDADGDGYTSNGVGNLFSDNFNRANSGDLGPDWTHSTGLGGGAASIVTNKVEKSGGTFAIAFRNGAFDADQWAEATFAGGGVSWSGVALRCDATSSVVWQCSGSKVQMLVMTNGSVRSIGKVNYTVVEGDVIRGEVSGTTYKVFINDNLVHTIINPFGANTSGNPGIMVEGYAMDDWSGGGAYNNAATDCDDTDAAVNPGATEVPYNGIDDDCNPLTLDDDLDGDGFDNANDCDDTDNTINATTTYYVDADGDGFGSTTTELLCVSTAPAGYSNNNTDCDDTDENVNPDATEIVDNGIDDDCNPATSDSSTVIDADGDGYTANEGDCNDSDSAVNPGATEVPYDGVDNDCNPLTLDDDLDGDGYTMNGVGNLFSDNFNRVDFENLGSNWTHSTGLGGGAASIVSNKVKKGGGTFAIAFRKGVFGDDQWAEATFAGGGVSWSGIALRCDATSSVVWQCSGNVVQMLVMINGSVSAKGRVNYTVVEGDVIRGEVNGTTYKVFINDNLVHTIVNPSGANTSGNPGIMVEGYAIDDWSGGDINNSAADCDDTDASVNPGETEIVGNGIDDDCNPATLDIIDVSKVSAIVGNKTVGTLGLDNFESLENKIKIYPNPFKDNITIKLPLSYNNSQLNIKIFDISGRLVFDKKYLSINRTINASGMSNLEQATYLVTITSQKTGKSIFKQLIKL